LILFIAMKRFTFLRPHETTSVNEILVKEKGNSEWSEQCDAPLKPLILKLLPPSPDAPSTSVCPPPGAPPPPCLSRQAARQLLHAALQASGSGGSCGAARSVCEVVTHAVSIRSVRAILVEAGVGEALSSFLQQPGVRGDGALVLMVLQAVQLLLRDAEHASPALGSAYREDDDFALRCVKAGLSGHAAALLEEYIGDAAVIAAVAGTYAALLRRGGLRTRKVIMSSGIIRYITNVILTYTTHVDSVIVLSSTLKLMMEYSSGYRRDHSVAIADAVRTMGSHAGNVHVARIVCILLSQRKWSASSFSSKRNETLTLTATQHDLPAVAELLVTCLQKWKRDECTVRCSLVSLRNLLLSSRSMIQSQNIVNILLSNKICETLMELMYLFRKNNSAVIEVINVVSLFDSIISMSNEAHLEENLLSQTSPVSQGIIISTKMRVNEISMDFRWKERKGFCCFLSELGCVYNPKMQSSSGGFNSASSCSTDDDSAAFSHPSSPTSVRSQFLSTKRSLSHAAKAAFSSRQICTAISAFI
jgi:hypothetical protein